MKSRGEANLKGIDVSHWDGKVDYAKVKASGVKVVYIKASEGVSGVDPMMEEHYKGAKAAGLKIGFYHFMQPVNEADATKQAQHFINTIQGKHYDCRLALDLEINKKSLSKDQITATAIAFLNQAKQLTGKGTVVYTYTSFVKENLTERLKDYRLWIAQYGVTWPDENGIWDGWIGFQSSEHGKVPGISGDCDIDEFTEDIILN
ncbi:MAG: GH25 family lysozyme [Cellulosilyticaceae bacterium]